MAHEQLFNLLCQYEQIGFMEAVRAYEPTQDLVRESEVKAWLKMMLVDYKQFKALVGKGHIKPFRKGEAKNSPWFYSKKQIKQALAQSEVSAYLRNFKLKQI